MDGGSSVNIIYLETLDLLGIERVQVQPSAGGFHSVVPGKKALPVGRIDLPVCFGTAANFRKETLPFEEVGFRGTYHTIIGRPRYAKFMAIPNYTYLKLKMPGPKDVITVSSSYEHAYECNVECIEYEEAVESSIELASRLEDLAAEAQEPKCHAGSFELAEGTKKIPLDPKSSDDKVLTISTNLDPRLEAVLVDFLRANADMFAWSPSDMPGILREVAEHSLEIRAGSKLVKQRLRRFDKEKRKIVGEEIHKLLTARFITEVHHPDWLANPVLVMKKMGK